MATNFPYFLGEEPAAFPNLRRRWGWFLAFGLALIGIGVLAINRPVLTTLTVMEVLGFLLLFGAGAQLASSFWSFGWGGFFLHLLCGLLYLFVGALILERPGLGAEIYTLILAVLFVASGLFRLLFALSHRFSGWGWTFFSGVVSLALGIIIWRNLPEAAEWVIGLFIGIDLIFIGWSWVMLAFAVRSLPRHGQRKDESTTPLAV